MIEIIDKSKCSGCAACANVCPRDCIEMSPDALGFLYPKVDSQVCIDCGLCAKICPVSNRNSFEENRIESAYATKNRDDDVRKNSSSGGVFSLLAQKVLDNGGVVYGAAFDEDCRVNHLSVSSKSDMLKLQGSKYVQSNIAFAYRDVEKDLKEGKQVLFTGTPCQVNGLNAYLRQEYDNLITQDLICHGVLSSVVFEKYLSYRAQKQGAKVQSMAFRDKTNGWKDYAIKISFDDGSQYSITHTKDEAMRVYLKNYALRPSCYKCAFKGKNRTSDITLADFWGAKNIVPQMDDDKGLSFVICHSTKGSKFLQSILANTESQSVNYEDVIRYNMSGEKSASEPKNNNEFCKEILENSFAEVVEKYCKVSFKSKLKRVVKAIVKKIKI